MFPTMTKSTKITYDAFSTLKQTLLHICAHSLISTNDDSSGRIRYETKYVCLYNEFLERKEAFS